MKHDKLTEATKKGWADAQKLEAIASFARKHSDEALQASKLRYQHLFKTAKDGIIFIDADTGQITDINPSLVRMLGYPQRSYLGKKLWEIEPFRSIERGKVSFEKLLSEGYVRHEELLLHTKDGQSISVEFTSNIYKIDDKMVIHCNFRDISERKQAEEAMRRSEQRFQEMAHAIHGVFWLFDWDKKKVDYVSPAYEKIWGRSAKDLYDRMEEWDQSIHPDDVSYVRESFDRVIHMESEGEPVEYRIIRPDGGIRWISNRIFPVRDASGRIRHVTGFAEDVTDRKAVEEELFRSYKIESIGILAGAIAHDFNNILTVIIGNINLARMRMEPAHQAHNLLERAEKISKRAIDLTKQILTFSRGGEPLKEAVPTDEFLLDATALAAMSSKAGIRFNIDKDVMPIEVDVGQMRQVILNIVLNAIQSMPEGGFMVIGAKNVLVRKNSGIPLPEGSYVQISVADQGHGIPKNDLDKIFDPYYTTKEKGRGLGLAIAYSVVKRHNGYIQVDSQVGAGTIFTMYLPVSKKILEEGLPEEEKIITGSGNILIMDDESEILEAAGAILKELGYQVKFARDGMEAIDSYVKAKEASQPFDAIIMDLSVLKGMGGLEATNHLLKIDPDAKVIVSSGYSNDPIMIHHKAYGFSSMIPKPYKMVELGKVLNDVLKGKQ
jgi:PAS domain S-box-containing protein